jgi:arylsulfatase A
VPIIGSDFFPTALGIAGVKPPADRVFDGTDVRAFLTGEAQVPARSQPLFWRLNMAPNNLHMAMRQGDWKIIAAQDFSKFELYNLKLDPKEETDLKDKEKERFERMKMDLTIHNEKIEKEGPDWWKRLSPNGGGPIKKEKK